MSTWQTMTQHTSTGNVTIVVNGEPRQVNEGETIAGLVRALELDPQRLAVELDRRIVKRAQWATTQLAAGAELEIVMFVGGG